MMKEKTYWNQRYGEGGSSGWCSVGKLGKWRWSRVKKNVRLKNKSILDVGCGDLRFWEGIKHKDYTGIDISSVVIESNKDKRPNWNFICADASMLEFEERDSFDVVFCFEMLFHIMSEVSYRAILRNLNRWTGEMLFISCWSERPKPFVYPHYQAHYQIEDYMQHLPDLQLKRHYTTTEGLRAMYVFTRKGD
jgi:2-polyprenyl-3-methyl-5-hydroxy-6-metoxy-1,4-benzoquinol methylase